MGRSIDRRSLLQGAAATLATTMMGASPRPDHSVRAFHLVEAAGLRRFGYPVRTVVPGAGEGRHFRLIRDNRAIPAQFRTIEGLPGRREVVLDFIANPGPLESASYEVHFGSEVAPGPEPSAGLRVERRDSRIFVKQASELAFEVAEDLSGFLRGVGNPRLGYVREGSKGLTVREAGGPFLPISGVRTSVIQEGPIAVGLRSEWSGPSGSSGHLDLTIPQSKSWAEVAWTMDDPAGRISSLGLDLDLLIGGLPTLVDFGAGSTVYGQLKENQRAELVAGRAAGELSPKAEGVWVVRLGEGVEPPVFAESPAGSSRPAEGWAHVMDDRRCTALAVAEFGRAGARDRISVGASGSVRLVREFAVGDSRPASGPKVLAFWLHFVPMPVQVGAATSPQSILAPLRVDWDRPSD